LKSRTPRERIQIVKRPLLVVGVLCLIVLAGVMTGCGSSNETSTPPDDNGGVVTTGKAQALVFTTPT
jgi:hypothetical protein